MTKHYPSLALSCLDLDAEEVRERFRWAARQGHPQWLWPDLTVDEWSHSTERIAEVTREVMTLGTSRKVLAGSADAIGIAGYTSGLGPLLGLWLEQGRIECSPMVAAVLELHLRHNRLRMARLTDRARALSAALSAKAIAHTFLKGMHTAHRYFPERGTRPMSDIDLLIAPDDEALTGCVLRTLGFSPGLAQAYPPERSWRPTEAPELPRNLALVHADDPWTVDLHTSLNRRYAAGSPVLRIDEVAAGNRLPHRAFAPSARVLAQPSLLVHLTTHAGCGLESLSMLRLVELVFVIRRDMSGGPAAWDQFVEAAASADALGGIYPALEFCEQLVPGTVPARVLRNSRQAVPPPVRRVVDRHTVVDIQRVERCSLAERFMWAPSKWAVLRQILGEIFPPGSSVLPTLLAIYRARLWRLARRTMTR